MILPLVMMEGSDANPEPGLLSTSLPVSMIRRAEYYANSSQRL